MKANEAPEQYISKSALVAAIARQKAQWRICKSSEAKYRREMLDDISSFLDTLEVKEVKEEPVSEDLELSWEDIPKIFQISEELKTSWWFRDNEQTKLIGTQVFWEEVLKRFKEGKGDKHRKEDKEK